MFLILHIFLVLILQKSALVNLRRDNARCAAFVLSLEIPIFLITFAQKYTHYAKTLHHPNRLVAFLFADVCAARR